MPVNSKVSKEVSSPNVRIILKVFQTYFQKHQTIRHLKEKPANPVAEKKNETEISTEKNETVLENMVVQPAEKRRQFQTRFINKMKSLFPIPFAKADENAKPVLPVVNKVESNDAGGYKKTVIVRKSESSTTQDLV
jgi:hypothetical protein